ncbi:UNVERIFIED_ORG: hypothetical protein J2X79_001956 [Arthrobacter globiformis]|nr:hypothetical protein [Arthrobacter globiformis]
MSKFCLDASLLVSGGQSSSLIFHNVTDRIEA